MSGLADCRVLVTPTSYAKNDPRLIADLAHQVKDVIVNPLGRPLTSAEVAGLLPGCDGYIAGLDVIDRAALEAADRLKVIARYGVGLDSVDLEAARQKGITVTYTPGANSISVAELTVGLILSLARGIPQAVDATRKGEWPRWSGLTIEGKTVGLIGLGAIGKQVARRLSAFDCRMLAYDPIQDLEFTKTHHVEWVELDTLTREADFVSLHLPLLPETRGLVNNAFLARMKPSAYLINTARGELIDESALANALQGGILAGAALDVFSQEPPRKNHPLLHLPQGIVTPHCGSHTDGATNAMGWMALNDCLAVLRGEAPRYPVISG